MLCALQPCVCNKLQFNRIRPDSVVPAGERLAPGIVPDFSRVFQFSARPLARSLARAEDIERNAASKAPGSRVHEGDTCDIIVKFSCLGLLNRGLNKHSSASIYDIYGYYYYLQI